MRVSTGGKLTASASSNWHVVLHEERAVIEESREIITAWLTGMGLELKASKTRLAQTLETTEGAAGFDFLGFHIQQYPAGIKHSQRNGHQQVLGLVTHVEASRGAVKRHTEKLHQTVKRKRGAEQEEVIQALNPQIAGWTNYYRYVSSQETFHQLGKTLFAML